MRPAQGIKKGIRKWRKRTAFLRVFYVIQYVMMRAAITFMQSISVRTAFMLADFAGNTVSRIHRKHFKRGIRNLRRFYGRENLRYRAAKGFLKRCYRHYTKMGVEIIRTRRMIRKYNYRDYVKVEGLEILDQSLRDGKGAILTGGHLGNWEISGYVLALLGYPLCSMARAFDNELIDQYFNGFRKSTGQDVIYSHGGVFEMVRMLKRNRFVAILIDQDARKEGVFVDFLGRKASTTKVVAAIALKMGCPIIPFTSVRVDKFKYTLTFGPRIDAKASGNHDDDIRRVTQEVSDVLQSNIIRHPDQWIWMHRRWKTQPDGAVISKQ
jgi:KDO2-lipid IV(A) lauroyltransferase